MPRIGGLRHQVSLETPTRVADGQGGFTESFAVTSPSPVWSEIEPATPSKMERLVGNSIQGTITHLITLRYHAGVTTKTRVTFGSRRFYVRGIQNVEERGQWLRLSCEESLP